MYRSATIRTCKTGAVALALASAMNSTRAADHSMDQTPPEPAAINPRIDKTWEFVIAPYFVGANIAGTSQVGRLPATDLDINTRNILENLHFGGMVRAEANYGQTIGAFVDIAYMKLGNARDFLRTGGRARLGVKQLVAETMLTYRPYKTDQSYIDIYAGGRYWDITLDLNITGSIAGTFVTERGDSWIDPVVGIRGSHKLSEKWSLFGRADVGGFGVGSDFTWNIQGGAGYHFNDRWAAHLQYKALSVDYDNGRTGTSSFEYDTITHGPIFGIAATF